MANGDPLPAYTGAPIYLCAKGDKERLDRKKRLDAGRAAYSKD